MREVALAAGLGKSSLFHHFETKAELYVAVIERVIARIEAHVLPALGAAGSAVLRIDRAVDALIDALAEHPSTARLPALAGRGRRLRGRRAARPRRGRGAHSRAGRPHHEPARRRRGRG
jgi:AcrR family transcriptional regulator